MTGWIVVGILYALGMSFFRLIGGIGAAGEAFRRWGESTAARRRSTQVSSSS
jgi:hypothetical protein